MIATKQRILILAADPKSMDRLYLSHQVRDIREGLRMALLRNMFTIEEHWALRIKDLRRALLTEQPNIVHFCGHGVGAGAHKGCLVFEDEQGAPQILNGPALSGLFELFADHVSCVILSAGYTQTQAAAIAKHIDYVIGMHATLDIEQSREFAVAFYDALGAGKSIEDAYRFGCNAILAVIRPGGSAVPSHMIPALTRRQGASSMPRNPLTGPLNPEQINRFMSEYRTMLARYQENEVAHFGLAQCYLQFQNYDGAIKHFQRSIELAPDNADSYYYQALASIRGRRTRTLSHDCVLDIEQALNTAIHLDPNPATYHYLRFILRMDYFAVCGIRIPPPSAADALRQARAGKRDAWEIERLLQFVIIRDQRIIDAIRQQ